MALVLGTNCGFVTEAPDGDPAGSAFTFDDKAWAMRDVSPANAIKITEIGWYTGTATQESNFEVGIYSDDGEFKRTRSTFGKQVFLNFG